MSETETLHAEQVLETLHHVMQASESDTARDRFSRTGSSGPVRLKRESLGAN